MTGLAARARRLRRSLSRLATVAVALSCGVVAAAQTPAAATTAPVPPVNSTLDAPLFYQLLIGEIELRAGQAGTAYEVILDAARRRSDDQLFQHAIEIALQARDGNKALAAARAWRLAKPAALAPARFESQILIAMNRADEAAEPLAIWLQAVPAAERPALITNLPRLLQRLPDHQQALALTEKLLAPWRDQADTRSAATLALGQTRLAAGDSGGALSLARSVQADDPAATGPVLLALEMLPATPAAERLITDYLARSDAQTPVRLAYVRLLAQSQRYAEAAAQLEQITREQPQLADPWLTLGALRVELRLPREAEQALQRYVSLVGAQAPAGAAAGHDDEAGDDGNRGDTAAGLTQAWLLLSQAAEQRGDLKSSEAWLAKIDNPQRALDVQSRRASLLAQQGKLDEARALIQAVPERNGDDARAKLMAEVQLLREAKQWPAAADLLSASSKRFVDDTDILYEWAMIEEKMAHYDEMERLLRRVIELKPDHPHARNALGYSLADRNVRLPEARALVQRALELSPGDPFITDSLGWIEYRLGNRDEALRLLRQAYAARPDTEIAAHLGEVLWSNDQRDEARRIWREARGRDADNEVLRETLVRLKVGL